MAKIMLVDDSAMMRSIIKNFINKSGKTFEYVEACDGDEAVLKFKQFAPDLIFMDIMMPKTDGITAAKQIKAINKTAKIIMCTSIKEKVHIDEAENLGISDYITKPFNSDQINDSIKKYFG